jgi:hypothetical protein
MMKVPMAEPMQAGHDCDRAVAEGDDDIARHEVEGIGGFGFRSAFARQAALRAFRACAVAAQVVAAPLAFGGQGFAHRMWSRWSSQGGSILLNDFPCCLWPGNGTVALRADAIARGDRQP